MLPVWIVPTRSAWQLPARAAWAGGTSRPLHTRRASTWRPCARPCPGRGRGRSSPGRRDGPLARRPGSRGRRGRDRSDPVSHRTRGSGDRDGPRRPVREARGVRPRRDRRPGRAGGRGGTGAGRRVLAPSRLAVRRGPPPGRRGRVRHADVPALVAVGRRPAARRVADPAVSRRRRGRLRRARDRPGAGGSSAPRSPTCRPRARRARWRRSATPNGRGAGRRRRPGRRSRSTWARTCRTRRRRPHRDPRARRGTPDRRARAGGLRHGDQLRPARRPGPGATCSNWRWRRSSSALRACAGEAPHATAADAARALEAGQAMRRSRLAGGAVEVVTMSDSTSA